MAKLMLYRIRKAKYLENYKINLTFNDGITRAVDLGSMLKRSKGVVRELLDMDLFKQVYCDGHTICWPNKVDFCPNILFKMSKNIADVKKRPIRIPVQRVSIRRRKRQKVAK